MSRLRGTIKPGQSVSDRRNLELGFLDSQLDVAHEGRGVDERDGWGAGKKGSKRPSAACLSPCDEVIHRRQESEFRLGTGAYTRCSGDGPTRRLGAGSDRCSECAVL